MAQYVDKDGWIEEVEEKDDSVWDNVVREEDDEQTVRLKKKLAKAEAELQAEKDRADREANMSYSYLKHGRNVTIKKNKKNMGWAESVGYDKQAKEKARTEGSFLDKYIKDKDKRMFAYGAIIVLALIVILLKFILGV